MAKLSTNQDDTEHSKVTTKSHLSKTKSILSLTRNWFSASLMKHHRKREWGGGGKDHRQKKRNCGLPGFKKLTIWLVKQAPYVELISKARSDQQDGMDAK